MNDRDQMLLSGRLAVALARRVLANLEKPDMKAAQGHLEHLLRLETRAEPAAIVAAFTAVDAKWPGEDGLSAELKRRLKSANERLATEAADERLLQVIENPNPRPFYADQQPLPDAMREAIEARFEPDAKWPFPPPYHGYWQTLDLPALLSNLALLNRALSEDIDFRFALDQGVRAGRIGELACYSGASMIELLLHFKPSTAPGGISAVYLLGPFGALPFDGKSPRIHELNGRGLLDVSSIDKAIGYLKFFCGLIQGEDGPFTIVNDRNDVATHLAGPAAPKEVNLSEISEPVISAADDDPEEEGSSDAVRFKWHIEAYVLYSTAVFKAKFAISEKGLVEMLGDNPVAADLSARQASFRRGRRAVWVDGNEA